MLIRTCGAERAETDSVYIPDPTWLISKNLGWETGYRYRCNSIALSVSVVCATLSERGWDRQG